MNSGPISIRLRYFALLREQRGRDAETLSIHAMTAEELYQALAAQYGFTLTADRIKVVINDKFCNLTDNLKNNDQIVFLPPVAGG